MVYAVRQDRPMISKTPLKKSRRQSEHSKKLEQFLKKHTISIVKSTDGSPVVITGTRDE